MKKNRYSTILVILLSLFAIAANAQMVGTSVFLQGRYTEVGSQGNATLGGINAPSTYHPHGSNSLCGSSTNLLAMVFDYGYDGWTTGTPPYMGDYTIPGSPWEGWAVEVSSTAEYANSTSCGFTGSLTGSWLSYTRYTGGTNPRSTSIWTGSAYSGRLAIKKEYRVDSLTSALVVTADFKNTTATTLRGVYYLRSCDPDNSQSWTGGSFSTINTIPYQNDYYHRVMVTATATGAPTAAGIPPQPLSLATKDCRAKAIIYTSWPISTSCILSNLWAGSASCVSSMYTSLQTNVTSDIAIGLLYNLCDIPPYDSSSISYAYVFNGTNGIDNAFPEPKINVNGVDYDSSATITACTGTITDTLPMRIIFGDDKNWKYATWTWAPATGLTSTTGTTTSCIIHSLTGTVTYTVTGSDSVRGQCACNLKRFYITVVPTSTGPPTVADVYYCQGETPSVLTASGVYLQWYATATGGTGSTTAPTPSTTTAGTTTYWVSQMPCAPNESARVPIRVVVTATPILTAANNGPICANDTLKLFANDTFTRGTIVYSWTGPGGFTSTSRNPVRPSATTADSGVYTVRVTVNGCPSNPVTTLAVVHYTPPAPTVGTAVYCQGDASVPLTAGGANIRWYYPTPTILFAGTPTPSTSVPGVFNYYATQTQNGCESPSAAYVVTVNPTPATPTPVDPGYCQYETPSALRVTGTTGTLTWYGPGLPSSGSATAPVPSTTVPGTYVYYVTQTVLGCVSARCTVTVTITPKPAPPVVHDTSYCQFVNAPALTAVGSNLKWYTAPSGGTALSTGAPVPATATVGTTTWYVSQTVSGCESDRAAISVTVLFLPDFTIEQSKPYVCQFDTLTLWYNGPSMTGAGFLWSLPTGAKFITGDSSTPNIVVKFDSLYLQTVYLTASSYGGTCSTTDTAKIKVVPEPVSDAFIKENICVGDTVTLALASRSSNAEDFRWDFVGASIITGNSNSGGPYRIKWNVPGIYVIKLQAFSTESCKGKITYDTVRVHELPDPRFDVKTRTGVVCLEDTINFECKSHNDAWSYKWTPEHYFRNDNRHSIWGRVELVGYVAVTVTDAFGCTNTDSVWVSPLSCCTVKFPSAFTPNGDGLNDVFRPIFDGYHRFHDFRIVNRWGQTVYESTNSDCAWDGRFAGEPQDLGVYYYFIKFDCSDGTGKKEHTEKGEVTLIR